MIHVTIDPKSGFCFGVVRAIEMAEKYLANKEKISSIGEMVHNAEEVKRLEGMGMKTISCADLDQKQSGSVLIRAHGEPPSTYQKVKEQGLNLVDATCPIVLKLQEKVKKFYEQNPDAQIVIYGKEGH
ncbi:MAG: 4-hydroxy-3-methylbut-2-enyl diphosphate reductase, partial [Salinivirgaceae bacterium]